MQVVYCLPPGTQVITTVVCMTCSNHPGRALSHFIGDHSNGPRGFLRLSCAECRHQSTAARKRRADVEKKKAVETDGLQYCGTCRSALGCTLFTRGGAVAISLMLCVLSNNTHCPVLQVETEIAAQGHRRCDMCVIRRGETFTWGERIFSREHMDAACDRFWDDACR